MVAGSGLKGYTFGQAGTESARFGKFSVVNIRYLLLYYSITSGWRITKQADFRWEKCKHRK